MKRRRDSAFAGTPPRRDAAFEYAPSLGLTWVGEDDEGNPTYDWPNVDIARVRRRRADGIYELQYLGSDTWVDTYTSRPHVAHSIATRRAAKAIARALAGGVWSAPG